MGARSYALLNLCPQLHIPFMVLEIVSFGRCIRHSYNPIRSTYLATCLLYLHSGRFYDIIVMFVNIMIFEKFALAHPDLWTASLCA